MKRAILFIAFLYSSVSAFSQIPFLRIIPDSSLSTATSAVITKDVVVLQSEKNIYGIDIKTNQNLWQIKMPYMAYSGALSLSGNDRHVMIHALKDGLAQMEILYTIDVMDGKIIDSIDCKGITIIQVYPIPLNTYEVGIIGQIKGKFSAAIMNKKTGIISQTFFKEGDLGNTIPNAMSFNSDGQQVAIALVNDTYEIRTYSSTSGKQIYSVPTSGSEIHDMNFSSDGKQLYFPDGKGNFWIVNTTNQQIDKKIITGGKHSQMALSANNKFVILSGWEGASIIRINLETNAIEKSNYATTSFSCNTDELGKYAVVTGRGVGPYFITKYPYCALYSIEPDNEFLHQSSPQNQTNLTFSKGDKVQVEWQGKWYNAEIIETKGSSYKVHYAGYGNEWDEWINSDRIKK